MSDRAAKAIVSGWNAQCQYIPKDMEFRYMLRYGKSENIEAKLTPKGVEEIQELVAYAKKHGDIIPRVPLREKYGDTYVGNIMREIEDREKIKKEGK